MGPFAFEYRLDEKPFDAWRRVGISTKGSRTHPFSPSGSRLEVQPNTISLFTTVFDTACNASFVIATDRWYCTCLRLSDFVLCLTASRRLSPRAHVFASAAAVGSLFKSFFDRQPQT